MAVNNIKEALVIIPNNEMVFNVQPLNTNNIIHSAEDFLNIINQIIEEYLVIANNDDELIDNEFIVYLESNLNEVRELVIPISQSTFNNEIFLNLHNILDIQNIENIDWYVGYNLNFIRQNINIIRETIQPPAVEQPRIDSQVRSMEDIITAVNDLEDTLNDTTIIGPLEVIMMELRSRLGDVRELACLFK